MSTLHWSDSRLEVHRVVVGPYENNVFVIRCKETGEEKVILTALCGHGHLDLAAYEKFLAGEMVDLDLSDEAVAAAMAKVPAVAG